MARYMGRAHTRADGSQLVHGDVFDPTDAERAAFGDLIADDHAASQPSAPPPVTEEHA